MAAVIDAVADAWETARKKRCFEQFLQVKCVKTGHEESKADAVDIDINTLDVDKMKDHILDCLVALGIVQQELVSIEQSLIVREGEEHPLTKETQAALLSNKVFKASLSITATAMIHDGTEVSEDNAVDRLLRAFPDESKRTGGRSWLPLHWAVVADEKSLTEAEMKLVYASDPMALQRYHLEDVFVYGYTPAHLLCMKEMTVRNMSLIRHFSLINQQAFTMSASYFDRGNHLLYSFSALHLACGYGQPTEELL